MPASIQRYSDPRLYGTSLVKPFAESYEWIRTVAHPWHPKCSMVVECAVRAMKVFTGAIALGITALPALVGRIIQIIHYHWIPKETRAQPPEVVIDGMRLPGLVPCDLPTGTAFHGTNEAAAIGILRWGFDPRKVKENAAMAEAVYISANPVVSVEYGEDQLILSLDLREGEVAYFNDNALAQSDQRIDFSDKKTMAKIRQLFFQNGYRAVRYDLAHYYGQTEAWAIYDPSCISIQKIRPSPFPVPPLENAPSIVSQFMRIFQKRRPQTLLVH